MYRSPKISDAQKLLVFEKLDLIPKSRTKLLSELKETGLTKHQIFKQLDNLIKDKKISKYKPDMQDQRRIEYYLNGGYSS